MWMGSRIATSGDGRLLNFQAIDDAIKAGKQARSHHDPGNMAFGLRQDSVIHRLAAAIEAESKDITFVYFTMHNLCWDLLEDMRDACRPYIAARHNGAWEPQKHNLPFIVGFVFSTVAGRKDIKTKGLPNEELLEIVADVTHVFSEEHYVFLITECKSGHF